MCSELSKLRRIKLHRKGLKKIAAHNPLENKNMQLLGMVQVVENSQAETAVQ